MHSPWRRGRSALATLLSLFAAVITYACSDTSSPPRIDVENVTPQRTVGVPPQGLVAAYGFEEPSGVTTLDASGNKNDGSLGAGVTRAPAGKFGAALAFNGNGMVTIPGASSLALTNAMTLSAWVYPTSVSAAWTDVIMKGNDNYSLMATSRRGPQPAATVKFARGKTIRAVFAPSNLVANTWTHLAATYDGATVRLYVNGAEVARIAGKNNILTSSGALRIGGDPYDGQFFRGTIDEVRVYNRALSAAELQTDMLTPVSGPAPVPPPDVATLSIASPTASGSYHTTSRTLSMSGASTGARVKRVTWTNSRGGSGTAAGTTAWSATAIALQTGTNDLTVVARDSADSALANASLSVTVDEPPAATPTQLFIQTQPSATAQTGVPLTQQPVIQLRDAANNAIPVAGVTVAATIASGGGSLGGTTLVATNASGVATFTNLQITGTAGTRTLTFSATGLTSVTSTAIAVAAAGAITVPPTGLYPNRPASFTQSSEIDFSQTPVTGNDQVDRAIPDAPGWSMIYFGSAGNNWSKVTDASAPQSAPGVWQGRWAAGSYGGGVIGQGDGHGIGNVFTYGPGNVFLTNGPSHLYVSMRVYFDFDASQWHPISNKFVNITGDHSQLLMQLKEGGPWRHAEELGFTGFPSWGIDNNGTPTSIPGLVDNRPVPTRQWVQIELLIDLPGHVFKVWQDGVLTTNATPTFSSTKITVFGVNAFRGGGGETLTTDLNYKYDHFFIAW